MSARISLATLNLWHTQLWPERRQPLGEFLARFRPDLLCLQELRPQTREFLDQALPEHRRVEDPLPGWSCESNIYWRARLFEELAHGAEPVGHLEPERRLFWVRLRRRDGGTLLVATTHLTYQGNPQEVTTGHSPRVEQCRRITAALQALVEPEEPAFLMGDFNDPYMPRRILGESGWVNCFEALHLVPPVTFPAAPTAETYTRNEAIDWIFANHGPRPLLADAPRFCFNGMAASDHWPVVAVYETPAP